MFAGFLIFVLFGFSPSSDIVAHLGGFVAGVVFGALLSLVPQRTLEKRWLNGLMLVLLVILIFMTWGLALMPARPVV